MLWGISEMVNARAFKSLPLCSAALKTVLVGISGVLRNEKKATFSAEMCFEKMLWGISEMVNGRALTPVPLCSAALETY